jgi:hypothetical protein
MSLVCMQNSIPESALGMNPERSDRWNESRKVGPLANAQMAGQFTPRTRLGLCPASSESCAHYQTPFAGGRGVHRGLGGIPHLSNRTAPKRSGPKPFCRSYCRCGVKWGMRNRHRAIRMRPIRRLHEG